MRKILSVLIALAFLAGGMARAQSAADTTGSPSKKSHSHKKRSKKAASSKKKRSKGKKTGKRKKGSKNEDKVEAKTDIGQKDVEIDLKGQ